MGRKAADRDRLEFGGNAVARSDGGWRTPLPGVETRGPQAAASSGLDSPKLSPDPEKEGDARAAFENAANSARA